MNNSIVTVNIVCTMDGALPDMNTNLKIIRNDQSYQVSKYEYKLTNNKNEWINSKVLWSFQRFNGSHSTNKALGVALTKK